MSFRISYYAAPGEAEEFAKKAGLRLAEELEAPPIDGFWIGKVKRSDLWVLWVDHIDWTASIEELIGDFPEEMFGLHVDELTGYASITKGNPEKGGWSFLPSDTPGIPSMCFGEVPDIPDDEKYNDFEFCVRAFEHFVGFAYDLPHIETLFDKVLKLEPSEALLGRKLDFDRLNQSALR
ncbi:hypothetical protein [uncultured Litoreibacter sp.]|uniref:hypothetical protein n=1 Tax=uncultured Litoreibacter sp. TaxID=1392394 RepID=UPI00261515EC|nr:hypothetical protein [uncultured Litoreibacter sp.]